MTDFELSYFDILAPDLPVVFCGINPSSHAATTGQNFGSSTNRFWRVLHLSGFTSVELSGGVDRQLLEFGCGITAVVGRATGSAGELRSLEFREAEKSLRAKLAHFRPKTIAFLGKAAYETIAMRKVDWGPQPLPLGGSDVWVLPNPSGRNLGYSLEALVTAYSALRVSRLGQFEVWAEVGLNAAIYGSSQRGVDETKQRSKMADNFLETAQGQLLSGAHRYLSAARELRYSNTWFERPSFLQAPTIHLLAHGVELLLKYPLLAAGSSPEEVRKEFGHDLIKLWNADVNKFVRPLILDRAAEAWEEAKSSSKWPWDNWGKLPREELKSALDRLDFLHGRDSGFALRYIVTPNTYAPRPAFLIDVFGDIAERGLKNPRLLTEQW